LQERERAVRGGDITTRVPVLSFFVLQKDTTYIKQARSLAVVSAQKPANYEALLKRLQDKLGTDARKATSRLEIPQPQIIWVGKNTIFRNFMDFPKALRRDPEKILLYLNKELASAGYIQGERVIFLGRKTPSSFNALIDRYVKDYVQCPVCGSPDTRTEKNKKLGFLICEACGAKSSIKGNYA
jgi:translation initiation factor 2 subunit 2